MTIQELTRFAFPPSYVARRIYEQFLQDRVVAAAMSGGIAKALECAAKLEELRKSEKQESETK